MKGGDIMPNNKYCECTIKVGTFFSGIGAPEKADLSHDYIRQIESEKIANTFSVQTIYDISVALDVSIELLFKNE